MARDYYTLQPDKIYLLPPNHHHTRGREGKRIEFITRHHLMMIGEGEAVVDRVWNSRPASAHHVIGPTGRWVQTVYDRDTAWANANWGANLRTIAIEHSNSTGRARNQGDFHPDSWNISDETIKTGARVAAAYCLHEKLGKPVYGRNIRDHFEFTSTGCPVHLSGPKPGNGFGGRAGKYHQAWMDEATWFYDQLAKKLVAPDGTPINHFKKKEKSMFGPDQVGALDEAKRYSRDTKAQLTGSGKLGEYPGWEQLGGRTVVDALGVIGAKLGIDGFRDTKEA